MAFPQYSKEKKFTLLDELWGHYFCRRHKHTPFFMLWIGWAFIGGRDTHREWHDEIIVLWEKKEYFLKPLFTWVIDIQVVLGKIMWATLSMQMCCPANNSMLFCLGLICITVMTQIVNVLWLYSGGGTMLSFCCENKKMKGPYHGCPSLWIIVLC